MSKTTNKFSPEIRECAVRLGLDIEGPHGSRWQSVMSISAKIGCAAPTLNEWVRKAEVDSGKRAGIPADMVEKMNALERENRELHKGSEILRKASAYFAMVAHLRSCRIRHPRMGRLVQQLPPDRADREHPASRGGSKLILGSGD